MIYAHEIPAPNCRYMPKAHAGFTSRLLQDAWRDYQERQFPEAERQRIGEIVAAELERRNPAADMDVLERYGLTRLEGGPKKYGPEGEHDTVTVSTYNPYTDQWEGVGVQTPRPVRVASRGGWGGTRLRANARPARYAKPNFGISPEWETRHKAEGKWDEIIANNNAHFDALEADSLPPETDAFFQRVIDLRKAYREQYEGFHAWLADRRQSEGKYPRWDEIESAFPFIGEFLARERVAEAA